MVLLPRKQTMRFKNPGGELSWLTPLLCLSGSYLAYVFYREGSTAMAVMSGSLAVMCLLVWFDVKWVAIPLIGWFSLVLVGGLLLVCFKEFSWSKLIHLGALGYTIYALWEWYRRREPEDVDPEMEELERLSAPVTGRDEAPADDLRALYSRDPDDDPWQRLDDARRN